MRAGNRVEGRGVEGRGARGVVLVAVAAVFLLAACNNSDSPASINRTGNSAFADADYQTALTSYESVLAAAPELSQARYNMGNTHFRMNEYDAALEALTQASAQMSTTVESDFADFGDLAERTAYNAGNVHFASSDFEAAIESYKAALRINPNDMDAKVNLELALRNQQSEDESESEDEPTPTPTPSPTPEPEGETPTPTPESPSEEGTPTATMTPEPPTETPTPTPGGEEGGSPTPGESPTATATAPGDPTPDPSATPTMTATATAPGTATPDPMQTAQPNPAQPTLLPGELSPEEAARILEAAADQTETLQEQLQQNQPVQSEDVDKDW